MDVSFSEHVDKLILQLKRELVRHYDRDVAGPTSTQVTSSSFRVGVAPEDSDDSEEVSAAPGLRSSGTASVAPVPPLTRHGKRLPSAKSRLLPRKIFTSTSSTDSSEEEGMLSPGKGELLTPKPKLPEAPKDTGIAAAPDATPKMLMTSQAAGTFPNSGPSPAAEKLPLPNTIDQVDSCSESGEKAKEIEPIETNKTDDPKSSSSSSSSSSSDSASFASTSDGEGTTNMRNAFKRRSDSSIPSFFKTEDRHSRIWQFLEDPDSSKGAFYFASAHNYFLTLTSIASISQASVDPLVPNVLVVNALQCVVEALFILDCMVHWYISADLKAFLKSPYNIIDMLAVLPLPLRLAVAVPVVPSMEELPVAHFILVCFVPLIRLLKLVRRFQKLQLLLHVLATVSDALKLLLYLVSVIVLMFSTVLYVVDDPANVDSLSTAIYMSTVTVTTVGYGDVTPKTWPARFVSGILCFISVLFMAMPLSVVGNAMSQTWSDRHRILLVTRARQRLKNWGVSAGDMPRLFKKFDSDGNGELGMDEFIDLISRMKIGMKPSEASDLFLAFDTDGSGGIDEKEFMKALFPLDYRRMYRRQSGMTFGA